MQRTLELSMREIDRLRVIHQVIEGKLKRQQAAEQLGLSYRQVKRVVRRVTQEGHSGMVHRLRGRQSNHRLSEGVMEKAVRIVAQKYSDFGPTFANEKLREVEGLQVSTNSLRKGMIEAGLWKSRRNKIKHRRYRERRSCIGELVQLDGSDHDWFEGRADRCALVVFIDDASSKILHAEFVKVEETLTLLSATRRYLLKRGRPVAFYVDRDSIYKVNRQQTIEEQLRDTQPMSQFSRAMKDLNIEVISATSPQAKGRVERGFKTHQDRLVKELRLAEISTMGAANTFLNKKYIAEHNRKFAVRPKSSANAHKPILPDQCLDKILSIRIERCVAKDFTVRFNNLFLQILPKQRVRPSDRVLVELRLDGSMHIRLKDRYLRYQIVEKQQPFLTSHIPFKLGKKPNKPANNHPWKQFFISEKAVLSKQQNEKR